MLRASGLFLSSVLSTLFLLSGCGGGGGGGTSATGIDVPNVDSSCASLMLDSTSVESLGKVRVSGLSGNFLSAVNDPDAGLYAILNSKAEDSAAVWVPLFIDNSGAETTLELPVGFDSADPYSNSDLDVSLVSGTIRCEVASVAVQGMQKANSGNLDLVLDKLQALVQRRADAYSIADWAALQSAINDYVVNGGDPSVGLLQVFMAGSAVQQLRDYAAQISSDDKTLLASILSKLDYITLLQARLDNAISQGPAPNQIQTSITSRQSRLLNTEVYTTKAAGVCATVVGEKVAIPDAYKLDYYMNAQREAQDSLQGDMGDFRAAAGATSPLASAAMGGPAGATLGVMMFVEQTLSDYDTKALPSKFVDMQVKLDPANSVNEDLEKVNKELFWKQAQVWVSSEKWSLTGPALDALSQSIGAAKAIKGLNAEAQTFYNTASDVMADYGQNVVFNKLKSNAPDVECLEIPVYQWGPIDISEEEWSDDEVTGQSIQLGARLTHSRALSLVETGSTSLDVRTKSGKFGGKQTSWQDFVLVKPTRVVIDPNYHKVTSLGEAIDFTIRVRDTERPEVKPVLKTLPAGFSLISGPTDLGSGNFSVKLKSSIDASNYPAKFAAYRDAVVLPLEPREGSADIIADEEITLSPAEACVRKGDQLEMQAVLQGFEDNAELSWEVSGVGSVNYQPQVGELRIGVFSSNIEGSATVSAAATGQNGKVVSNDAIVNVGSCDSKVYVYGQYNIDASALDAYDEFNIDDTEYPIEPLPPEVPTDFWQGRTETNSANVMASGAEEFFGDGGSSTTIQQSASGFGAFDLAADGDGVVDLNFEYSGSDECDEEPFSDPAQVECSTVTSGAVSGARFYTDISEAQSYMLHIDVNCARTGDSWGIGMISALFYRFDEDGNPLMPNGSPTAENPGEYTNGVVVGVTTPVNVCDSAHAGVFSFTDTIDLVGPSTAGTTDKLILQVDLVEAAGNNHYEGYDLSDEYINLGYGGVPPNQQNLPDEATGGDYTGTTKIDATISFYPISP